MKDWWSQGFLLRTPVTNRMNGAECMEADTFERRRIYRKFTVKDQGRSRELVATCDDAETAAHIVDLHNASLKMQH